MYNKQSLMAVVLNVDEQSSVPYVWYVDADCIYDLSIMFHFD